LACRNGATIVTGTSERSNAVGSGCSSSGTTRSSADTASPASCQRSALSTAPSPTPPAVPTAYW
jgi:hypothetical protein